MRVLVTQEIDPIGLQILVDAGLEVDVRAGPRPIDRAVLLDRVGGCAGLVPMPTDPIDAAVLDAGPLRVVAQHAVGFDNLDLDAARARGVICTNTPGVLTDATADLAMTLLLAASRRVVEGDRLVRRGEFEGWRPTMLRGLDLRGAVLGVIGMGRIGRATAERALAFGMTLVHHRGDPQELPSRRVGLDELLGMADVVSLHCPLRPETRGLIGAAAFSVMKSTAVLVNTSRGPVVDESALAEALKAGEIAAAGLDVYAREPEVEPALLALDNVILAPHLGSATRGTRRKMAELAARNMVAALRGDVPPNRIA